MTTARDYQAWWRTPQWRTEATDWIREQVDARGIGLTGPVEQPRVRFWSTQLTVPTTAGVLWFKENNPGQRFEAALLQTLARLAPGRVLDPLAVEPGRGWFLARDAGPTLKETGDGAQGHWTRVLQEFAQLQRDLVPHQEEVLGTGLPRMRTAKATAYLTAQLDVLAALPAAQPLHLDTGRLAAIRAGLPVLERAAEILAAAPVPDSLQHNDLHDNNAFAPSGQGPLRFFDLGDAVWAHPFAVLLVPLDLMQRHQPGDRTAVERARDAYLEVWGDLHPASTLREVLDAALLVGATHRFESWRRLLAHVPPGEGDPWTSTVTGWLERAVRHTG